MKALVSIISPVLPASLVILVLSSLAAGSVGPCGLNGPYGGFYFIGYPVGFIGTLVGLWRSVVRALRYFNESNKNKNSQDVEV